MNTSFLIGRIRSNFSIQTIPASISRTPQEVNSEGYWYRSFEYALDRESGLDSVEDLLLGPFIDAYFKVKGNGKQVQDQVREWLRVFSVHLTEAGLGHVSGAETCKAETNETRQSSNSRYGMTLCSTGSSPSFCKEGDLS